MTCQLMCMRNVYEESVSVCTCQPENICGDCCSVARHESEDLTAALFGSVLSIADSAIHSYADSSSLCSCLLLRNYFRSYSRAGVHAFIWEVCVLCVASYECIRNARKDKNTSHASWTPHTPHKLTCCRCVYACKYT